MLRPTTVLLLSTLLAVPARAGRVGAYGGVVSDTSGHRVEGAQILLFVPGERPRHAFTSGNGLFSIELSNRGPDIKVITTAPGFLGDTRSLPPGPRAQVMDEIVLKRTEAGPVRTLRSSTSALPSGWGAGWSGWYHLCSNPLPPSEEVVASRFWLVGDRSCGAWSECREGLRSTNQVCWDFRLQGHSEGIPTGKAVGYSTGVLEVDVQTHPGPANSSEVRGTVFLMAATKVSLQRLAAVAADLRAAGFRVAPTVLVPGPVATMVRAFQKADFEKATALASRPTIGGARPIPVELEVSDAVPSGIFQVWLGDETRGSK